MFHRSFTAPHKTTLICCVFLINFPLFPWTNPTIIPSPNPSWWTLDTLTRPSSIQLPFPTIFPPLNPLKQPSASSCRSSYRSSAASCRNSCRWLFEVQLQAKPPKGYQRPPRTIYTFLHLYNLQIHPPSPPNCCHIHKQINYMHDNFT